MSHKGIRLLIEDVAKSLGDDIQFTYARTSDFNNLSDKRYPFISLDPLSSTASYAVNNVTNYSKTWVVNMAFYQQDNTSSDQTQYQLILDEMSDFVDQFINKMNFYSFNTQTNSDKILIQSINQQPFIKATADILTGYLLSMQLQVQDDFNYCGFDC